MPAGGPPHGPSYPFPSPHRPHAPGSGGEAEDQEHQSLLLLSVSWVCLLHGGARDKAISPRGAGGRAGKGGISGGGRKGHWREFKK